MRRHSFRKRRFRVIRSEADSATGEFTKSLVRAMPPYRPVEVGPIEALFKQLNVNRPLSLPKSSSGPLYQGDSTPLDIERVDEATGNLVQGPKFLRLFTNSMNRTIKKRIFQG